MKLLLHTLLGLSFISSATLAQLAVDNSDFTDINWSGGNTTSIVVNAGDSDNGSPMEASLGTNWRSNPADLPGRDGVRSILLGTDYSPATGRDGFASLALYDGAVIWTYLGQATGTGKVTIQWSTAARADTPIPQDELLYQFQTSSVGNFGPGWTPTVDAGGATGYSAEGIVSTDTEWQSVQHTSATVNAGDHVYFYWLSTGSSPASNQTLIQNVSVAAFIPVAILDVYSTDDLSSGFNLLETIEIENPSQPMGFYRLEITAP